MSRLTVTPLLAAGLSLALACLLPNVSWAQTSNGTPLRALEAQLGIPYGEVVPVNVEDVPANPPSASADAAPLAPTAPAPDADTPAPAAPNASPSGAAVAATPTSQADKIAAMRALLNVDPSKQVDQTNPVGPSKTAASNMPPVEQMDVERSTFERQLAAIRQALVDEALKGPTRVVSTAWMDQNGQLREDTQVTNGMQVRGVRVLNYLNNGTSEVVARIATDQQIPETPQATTCAAPEDPRWVQHVSFVSDVGQGVRGEDQHYARQLLDEWRAQWVQAADTQAVRWRQSVHAPSQLDDYQAAVQGDNKTEMADWQLNLQVRAAPSMPPQAPAPAFPASLDVPTPPAKTTRWQVDLQLIKRGQQQGIWQKKHPLTWDQLELSLVPPEVPPALSALIRQASADGVLAINAFMSCEPVQFSLLRQDGTSLTISGGTANGLRVGDRLVLVDSRELPKRVLHAGVAQRLALATVSQVGMAQSAVRQVAGPTLPAPLAGDWVAMPY